MPGAAVVTAYWARPQHLLAQAQRREDICDALFSIRAEVIQTPQGACFWQEQSSSRLLTSWRSITNMEFQHVASKDLCDFICGGTRTQFRCVGAGGWRRRRWRRRGRRGRRWQWSRWSGRRIRNHRQLKRPEQRSERQQRYSTLRRPKRSDWQWRCSTPRQHGPE
jgi:hypothetical protein